MAQVQLADIYNPLTFARREQEAQLELNKFLSSGVVISDGRIAEQIAGGGNVGELTEYNALDTSSEPDYTTDNPADVSTPDNIDSKTMRFRMASMHKSWSTMDLARELALQDPVGAITGRIGAYWAQNDEQRLISASLGILADNVANDGSDMLITKATDAAGAVTDSERLNAETVLDATQTMGDHGGMLSAIAMHSVLYTRLKKQNLIDFIPNARGEIVIPTYLNKTVIVDDSMPAVMGTNRITYTCILFGAGVFGEAMGPILRPSELEREASRGNGGGQDIIHSRRATVLHPQGFDWTDASRAGQSATRAELANGANWNRQWDRKHIPLAFIQVND